MSRWHGCGEPRSLLRLVGSAATVTVGGKRFSSVGGQEGGVEEVLFVKQKDRLYIAEGRRKMLSSREDTCL